MDNAILTSIITTVAGAIGWIGKVVYEIYLEKKKISNKRDYLARLRAIANVYSAMDNLKDSKDIDQVFLFEIGNGGHKPKPGSVLYARSIEVRLDDHSLRDKLLNKYAKVRLDQNYINMLIQTQISELPYIFQTNSHPDCLLKHFYTNENIKYSEIYHVFTDMKDEKMFVLSIATHKDNQLFEKQSLRAFINTEIMQIKNCFEEYRK